VAPEGAGALTAAYGVLVDAPVEVTCPCLQMTEQLGFLVMDHCYQLVVVSAAPASLERWQLA
jgi:hypothetical protein